MAYNAEALLKRANSENERATEEDKTL